MIQVPYDNKFWWKTKFGELVDHWLTVKFKFCQYYYIIIISTYAAFKPPYGKSAECWRRELSQSASSLYKESMQQKSSEEHVQLCSHFS